jgi:phage portal protein BeeE
MKLFGFKISFGRDGEAAVKKGAADYALSAGLWPDEARTGTVLSNAYEQVVWVYRAINALAEQVSNIPFRFSTESSGGEEVITSGPLVEFYDRPHAQINRFQYWELRVIWLMLRGECFRIPVFDGALEGGVAIYRLQPEQPAFQPGLPAGGGVA